MSGYESGYADGESSVEADIHVHLTEHCGKSDEDERAWPAYTLWMWREIERLRAVVDAAETNRARAVSHLEHALRMLEPIRALDGEPCPTCGGCGYLMTDDPRKDEDCLTCHGSGKSWKYKPGTTNEHEPRESCGGTGRKP